MEKYSKSTVRISTIILTIVLLSFSTTLGNPDKVNIDNRVVANLIQGIKSDNNGLQTSSIYFAVKYQVEEAVDALIEAFDKETNLEKKYLIALSLFLIDNDKGIEAVNDIMEQHIDKSNKAIATIAQ